MRLFQGVAAAIEDINQQNCCDFEIMLSALSSITEIMRLQKVEEYGNEIGKIFGAVTGNSLFLSKVITSNVSAVSAFRNEIDMFLADRIFFIINTGINNITERFKANIDTSLNEVKIGGCIYPFYPTCVNVQDLQRLGFAIEEQIKIYDYTSQYKQFGEHGLQVTDVTPPDLFSILSFLLNHWRCYRLDDQSKPYFPKTNVRVFLRDNKDYGSVRKTILLGDLIVKVASALYRGNSVIDPNDLDRQKQDMVKDEYNHYSNLGSMLLSSIICCFKNVKLLQEAVVNEKGYLGISERKLLLNTLVLSKLVFV